MALPATTVWEYRASATAANANGGGFNSARGGTDYTLQDAAQLIPTDLACTTTSTTLTSATFTFTDAMKGNLIHITNAGTGSHFVLGWYEIVSVGDAHTVTLDRSPTDGSSGVAGVGSVGGALTGPTTASLTAMVAGNIAYMKAGTYTLGASVACGTKSGSSFHDVGRLTWIGYKATRTDAPTGTDRPLITGAFVTALGDYWSLSNLSFTSSLAANSTLTIGQTSGYNRLLNCSCVHSGNSNGLSIAHGNAFVKRCYFKASAADTYAVTTDDTGLNTFLACYFDGAAGGSGLLAKGSYSYVIGCIFDTVKKAIAIGDGASATNEYHIINNTIWRATASAGSVGINDESTGGGYISDVSILGNIIQNQENGVLLRALDSSNISDFNTYFGNGTAKTYVTVGANDAAVNPALIDPANDNFTPVGILRGNGWPTVWDNSAVPVGWSEPGAVQPPAFTESAG